MGGWHTYWQDKHLELRCEYTVPISLHTMAQDCDHKGPFHGSQSRSLNERNKRIATGRLKASEELGLTSELVWGCED